MLPFLQRSKNVLFILLVSIPFLSYPLPSQEKNPSPIPTTAPQTQLINTVSLLSRTVDSRHPSFQDINYGTKAWNRDVATRVSVSGVFDLPIVQQPEDNNLYVADKPDILTQFRKPLYDGVTGLLAHNFLSGRKFYELNIGQLVSITYRNQIIKEYQIASIDRFQKKNPSNIYSNLIDLSTNKELSSTEAYQRFYRGKPHLTFQTCLEKEGRLDWGLLFIVALPVN